MLTNVLTNDAQRDLAALIAAQGTDRWHDAFKAADLTVGAEVRAEFRATKQRTGVVSVMDIAKIAVHSGVPWRTLFRFLEGDANKGVDKVLPSGTYESLMDCYGGTVGEILALARAALEQEANKSDGCQNPNLA